MPFLAYVQECIWDFRHVFFSLVRMIIKAKNLMLHFKTSIAPVQTIPTTWTFHRQTQTVVFFQLTHGIPMITISAIVCVLESLGNVTPCLFGHNYKPSPTPSLKLPSLQLSNCWPNRYFDVRATHSRIHQQTNILSRVHNKPETTCV